MTKHNNGTEIYLYDGEEESNLCGVWLTNIGTTQQDQKYEFKCNGIGDTVYLTKGVERIYIMEIIVIAKKPG